MKFLKNYIGITLASLVFSLSFPSCNRNVETLKKEGCRGIVYKYPDKMVVITQPEYFKGFDKNNDGLYETIIQGNQDIPNEAQYSELVNRAITRLNETRDCILGEQK